MVLALIYAMLIIQESGTHQVEGSNSGFFFQAEDGIRDLVRSRGLGDVYKRQHIVWVMKSFV